MIVSKLISHKLFIVAKAEFRPTQKWCLLARPIIDKCYHSLENNLSNQCNRVTSIGSTTYSIPFSNKSYQLSRAMSEQSGQNLTLNYTDILKAQGDNNVLIIDVRENSEIQETGKLPGSVHIPMGEVTNVLSNLSDEQFEKTYNRKKPSKESKIILSCKAGTRSAMVQADIQKLGYNNSYNYSGGWLDWEKKQKSQ